MTHDAAFDEHRARREAERNGAVKVTWRKVSDLTGGGFTGLGPDGLLVYVEPEPDRGRGFYGYGRVVDGERVRGGGRTSQAEAKRAAEILMRRMAGRAPYQTKTYNAPEGAEGGSMTTEAPTYYAEAVKLKKEAWQPTVFAEGVDEPVETAQAVRTKKEAEALAVNLLEAVMAMKAPQAHAPGAPTATEVADVTGIPTAGALAEGLGPHAEAKFNGKGTYARICVDGKALCYANPRKDGVLLDFARTAVEEAPKGLADLLEDKGTRRTLHVTADNEARARELLEWMAGRLAGATA